MIYEDIQAIAKVGKEPHLSLEIDGKTYSLYISDQHQPTWEAGAFALYREDGDIPFTHTITINGEDKLIPGALHDPNFHRAVLLPWSQSILGGQEFDLPPMYES